MGLFYKNNGTISVFLCLILLPVMLVGCMTVDASRIYLSKVVISDAGEMTMNAGLAQYNEELHDEYGLLVMNQSPEAMSGSLEGFFNTSLNGTSLPDADDYQKILDLLTESFEAVNVAGSEIYRTEVEKQQIVEYMKYRAPLCLTELVLDKFNEIKNTKIMGEAIQAETDFSESMQECQDSFQEALEALNGMNQAVENFPLDETIRQELESAEKDYKETISRCLLMREVIQDYDEQAQSRDLQAMAAAFIETAEKVDLSAPNSSISFNSYIGSIYYSKTVNHLGGVRKLLQNYDDAKTEEIEEDEIASGSISSVEEKEELQKIVNDYETQTTRISGYSQLLLTTAQEKINSHYEILNSYYETAKTTERTAKTAKKKLKDVKKKLEDAEDKFYVWDNANSKLETAGISGDMGGEVETYREFFSSGDGHSDLQDLEALISKVEANEGFFDDLQKVLKEEKFFGKSIVSTSAGSQMSTYISEADSATAGIDADYFSVENARSIYISNYEHTDLSTSHKKQGISTDPFYNKLKEYCSEQNGNGSQSDQDAANNNLQQSENAGAEAANIADYPQFNWSEAGVTLPSTISGASERGVSDELISLGMDKDISDGSARSDAVKNFNDSISEAVSFLDKVDKIVADGLQNLYVAEYAMQMFSYYTVDKEDGQDKPAGDIISLSGYNLQNHPAYRGEVEYILWGDESSQTNVGNTMMMIFGIRLLFNSFYAFTDAGINTTATTAATAIAGATPYLIPIIKAVIKLGYAGVETANDISKLKQGYGVTIFKDSSTWVTGTGDNTKNTKGVTFDYSEYLRIFLNVSIIAGHETDILARISDCIQVNKPSIDLLTSYTMIQIDTKVSTRTTFMRRISDFGSGGWGFPDDTYSITYQSILGY